MDFQVLDFGLLELGKRRSLYGAFWNLVCSPYHLWINLLQKGYLLCRFPMDFVGGVVQNRKVDENDDDANGSSYPQSHSVASASASSLSTNPYEEENHNDLPYYPRSTQESVCTNSAVDQSEEGACAAPPKTPVLEIGLDSLILPPPPGFGSDDVNNPWYGLSEGSLECVRAINQTLRVFQEEGYSLKTYRIPEEAFMFWTETDLGIAKECARLLPDMYPHITKLYMADCKDPADSEARFQELEDEYDRALFAKQEAIWKEQFERATLKDKYSPLPEKFKKLTLNPDTSPPSANKSSCTSAKAKSSSIVPFSLAEEDDEYVLSPASTPPPDRKLPNPIQPPSRAKLAELKAAQAQEQQQQQSNNGNNTNKNLSGASASGWPPLPPPLLPPLSHMPPQGNWQSFYESHPPPMWQGGPTSSEYKNQQWTTSCYAYPPPPPPIQTPDTPMMGNYFYPTNYCERQMPCSFPYQYGTPAMFSVPTSGPPAQAPPPSYPQPNHRGNGNRNGRSKQKASGASKDLPGNSSTTSAKSLAKDRKDNNNDQNKVNKGPN